MQQEINDLHRQLDDVRSLLVVVVQSLSDIEYHYPGTTGHFVDSLSIPEWVWREIRS